MIINTFMRMNSQESDWSKESSALKPTNQLNNIYI